MPSEPIVGLARSFSLPEGDDDAPLQAEGASSLNLPSLRDDPELNRLAEMLPPEAKAELISVVQQLTVSHSGWLPTPEYLVRYEAALPGLAERIVRMPEREQEHRHRAVEESMTRDYKIRTRGQILAMVSLALLLAFSAYLVTVGQPAWAGRVAIFTIVAVVGIFVTGKLSDRKAKKDDDNDDDDE